MNKISSIFLIFTFALTVVSSVGNSQEKANTAQLEPCNTKECKEFFKAYKILTKRGHSEAMATLAELYYVGYGTEQDIEKALKWFRKAGKYGVLAAKHKAGVIYLQDTEFKDVDKGIDLLGYASRRGFSPSSYLLGKIYLTDSFVETNIKLADEHLSTAYKLNNNVAKQYAEKLYQNPATRQLELTELFTLYSNDLSASTTVDGSGSKVVFPVNEMETITVSAMSFEELFREQIARLNNSRPDTETGTGSKIAGKSCADLWACSTEQDGERIRDVLFSDWGLVAAKFRLN
ncbi:tetratricopeptide repeat protein [Shewanella maritima]|uniref:tetratricopeptide repeat protein n=1 Tax=Shewanella maritima TaxID=2520507 RepID=UPI003736FDEB